MGALLLDTTVLIDTLRGRPAVQRLERARRRGDQLCACAINVEEIYRGARRAELAAVDRLFGGLRLAPLGRDAGRQAGTWRREFAERGVTLSQSDCLIAAAAVTVGARLATGNPKDFPMHELDVEHWPVGP